MGSSAALIEFETEQRGGYKRRVEDSIVFFFGFSFPFQSRLKFHELV